MNTVRKTAEVIEAIDAEQSIVGWGSKPIPDRDGELIESSAWKLEQYRKNPVLMLSHDYSSPPVGKCLWVKSDSNGLKFKAKFANTERGKEIYQLYKEGMMNGFSVGFSVNSGGSVDHPIDTKYKGLKRVYKDVELLEISCVAIPSCPEALIEQVKSGKVVCKQLKDELEHVIEIVEKARLADTEVVTEDAVGETVVKEAEEKKEDACDECTITSYLDAHPEFVEAYLKKAIPKCPADGEYGMDYGDYDACADCSFAESCEEKSESEEDEEGKACRKPKPGKEDEEGGDKKKPVQKMQNPDGAPSIYDLVSCLNRTLQGSMDMAAERPVMVGETKLMSEPSRGVYVVDVFPVDYPSGNFIFSTGSKYYKMDYQYDEGMAECVLTGIAEPVEQGWVSGKYQLDIEQKEDTDIITKEGRVLSEKNRKLLKECIDKMGECSGMLTGFHEATGKPDAYTNLGKGQVEDEEDELEIEQKTIDLSDIIEKSATEEEETDADGLLEIDVEDLKAVLKEAFADSVKAGATEAVKNAVDKIRGKVI